MKWQLHKLGGKKKRWFLVTRYFDNTFDSKALRKS